MPQVFISYSHSEAYIAVALKSGLIEAGIETWLDSSDIPPGYPVQYAIRDGIRNSDILVVLVSRDALTSKWVKEELATAATCQLMNIGVKVLPVLLADVSVRDLPPRLRAINCVSGTCDVKEIVNRVLQVFDDLPIRVFLTPDKGKYNLDYYRYLNDRIRDATQEIWITGGGFNCTETNPEGKSRADAMIAALEDRLSHRVKVFRIQTGASIDPYWAQQILGLAERYRTMELWRLESDQHTPVSLAAIDPGSRSSSVAEIMLSDRRKEDPFGDYASVATFVRRDPYTAQIICSRIKDLCQVNGAYRVFPTADAFGKLTNVFYYFAYGSNMNVEQMKHRSGNQAEWEEIGRLPGHELTFDQVSDRYDDGGVATIMAKPQVEVLGVIWRVPWGTIVALDKDEGPALYEKRLFDVHGLSGRTFHCYAYVGHVRTDKPPSPSYLNRLIQAAQQVGLPRSYIESLRSKLEKE